MHALNLFFPERGSTGLCAHESELMSKPSYIGGRYLFDSGSSRTATASRSLCSSFILTSAKCAPPSPHSIGDASRSSSEMMYASADFPGSSPASKDSASASASLSSNASNESMGSGAGASESAPESASESLFSSLADAASSASSERSSSASSSARASSSDTIWSKGITGSVPSPGSPSSATASASTSSWTIGTSVSLVMGYWTLATNASRVSLPRSDSGLSSSSGEPRLGRIGSGRASTSVSPRAYRRSYSGW